ncbi:MAG: hypothetical protein IJS32_04960, partial [Kiritimatiellae bacterium]|nr:hypothetical protein [Kiritimatiellia bacterium]
FRGGAAPDAMPIGLARAIAKQRGKMPHLRKQILPILQILSKTLCSSVPLCEIPFVCMARRSTPHPHFLLLPSLTSYFLLPLPRTRGWKPHPQKIL